VGGWEIDIDTRRQVWTEETYRIHEVDFSYQPTVESGLAFYEGESQALITAAVQRAVEHGEPFNLELSIITARGKRRLVHAIGNPDLSARKVVGFFQDITERKLAEMAITVTLKEKESLLKEVHHRVKNNLQVITSLLRLESARSAHSETKSVLQEMRGRIRSRALLHEALYHSGTVAGVDLGEYLTQLAREAFAAHNTSPSSVQLRLDLGSVHAEMDQALPCGLIVNELLANALEHGFPDGHRGEVLVELHTGDEGRRLRLRVSDTGVGLPADFATRRNDSLGLQLISDLAGQLGGTLDIGPGPAAVFTVTCPTGR
jgi:two-component sensor histidine kinase